MMQFLVADVSSTVFGVLECHISISIGSLLASLEIFVYK